MEKVKLTKAQVENINRWPNKEQLITAKAAGLLEHGQDEAVGELSMEKLVRALYIGFEVEEEYKVGDSIVKTNGTTFSTFSRIAKVHQVFGKRVTIENGGSLSFKEIRHATPEEIKTEQERRVWKKIGREVNEIRPGDCIASNGNYYKVFDNIGCQKYNNHISPGFAIDLIEGGATHGFYPAESFIEFGVGEE